MPKKYQMHIIYEDKFCAITDISITIFKYYFPLPTSKTIMFEEIQNITLESALNVRHLWGPSSHFLNNWFHYDSKRSHKQHFLSFKLKDRRIMPALTPEDEVKVFHILRNLFQKRQQKLEAYFKKSQIQSSKISQQKQMKKVKMEEEEKEEEKEEQENRDQTSENIIKQEKKEQKSNEIEKITKNEQTLNCLSPQ